MRVLATLLLLWMTVTPAWAQQLNPICGDCDQNNSVNVADALLALQAAVGSFTLPAAAVPLCDVDSSGGPTTTDGLMIAQFSAGTRPTLGCSSAVASPPIPTLDPFDPGFGNCVQGQSLGNPWTFSVLGALGEISVAAPAVPNGSTAFALATQWVNSINGPGGPANYTAFQVAGSCFVVVDSNGAQAAVRIFEGGGICFPDMTGTSCVFGGN